MSYNIATMTRQEVFDAVVNHLLTQKRQSLMPSTEYDAPVCAYYGEGGLKCAAGIFIPIDKYTPTIETHSWEWVVGMKIVPSNHEDLICKLQNVHDMNKPQEWKEILRSFANYAGLTFNDPIEDNENNSSTSPYPFVDYINVTMNTMFDQPKRTPHGGIPSASVVSMQQDNGLCMVMMKDNNHGCSITNGAERLCCFVHDQLLDDIPYSNIRWVYMDSDGELFEILTSNGTNVAFNAIMNEDEQIIAATQLMQQHTNSYIFNGI